MSTECEFGLGLVNKRLHTPGPPSVGETAEPGLVGHSTHPRSLCDAAVSPVARARVNAASRVLPGALPAGRQLRNPPGHLPMAWAWAGACGPLGRAGPSGALQGGGSVAAVSSLQGHSAAHVVCLPLGEVGGCLFPAPCGQADPVRSRQREGGTDLAPGGETRGASRGPAPLPGLRAAPTAPRLSRAAGLQLPLPRPPAACPGLTASASPLLPVPRTMATPAAGAVWGSRAYPGPYGGLPPGPTPALRRPTLRPTPGPAPELRLTRGLLLSYA